jgi:hypothetical protein
MQVFKARLRLASFVVLIELVLVALLCSSCLVRHRTVVQAGKKINQPLLKATKQELLNRVHAVADPLHSFQMKVDMSPSVGNLYAGQVTDYPTISGIIFYRRPGDIRVIGLDPVVHGTAFDMLSVGNDFRVSIPPKSQFIVGRDDLPANSPNKLENLRPSAFRTALLINPPDPDEVTLIEDDTDETKSVYILMFIQHNGDTYTPVRNLYFDRLTLAIVRQKTFDAAGYITSQTRYTDWQTYSGVPFPGTIDIQRPQDGYELILKVTEMKMNPPELSADKFTLTQPPNAQVKVLK